MMRGVSLTLVLAAMATLFIARPIVAEICEGPVCEYTFVIRHGRTMTYRRDYNLYNVGLEGSDLVLQDNSFHEAPSVDRVVAASDVHTADGVSRNIIVVNGQFPGPAIEVMEGTQIFVNVLNLLTTEVVSLHWHGLIMEEAFWMDGTPFVSQFPIMPGHRFQYRLRAFPSGTHWYHSHVLHQMTDGLYGFLCVHPRPPVCPEYNIAIADWFHQDGITKQILHPYATDPTLIGTGDMAASQVIRGYSQDGIETNAFRFQSALINGRGRWHDMKSPLETFTFKSGLQYRLRLLGAAGEFAFEVSLDEHVFTVVAKDGADIAHVPCDSVLINPGERIDVLVEATHPAGRFWFRARTLRAGVHNSTDLPPWPRPDGIEQEVKAVVTYDQNHSDPTSSRQLCTKDRPCRLFNCPFAGYASSFNKVCINTEHTVSVKKSGDLDREFALKDPNFKEIILNTNFELGSAINGFRYESPRFPLFPDKEKQLDSCSEHCTNTTSPFPCVCTQMELIGYNTSVQLVISNLNPTMGGEYRLVGHHPMHLHGYNFAVVAVGYPAYNRTTGLWSSPNQDIVCESALCRFPRWRGNRPPTNLLNPPIHDTVTVPAHGYVVLRFRAWNPGHWLLHCHALSHIHEGMAMLLSTAPDRLMLPPEDLQEPGDFIWSASDYDAHMIQAQKLAESGIRPKSQNGQWHILSSWYWILISCLAFLVGVLTMFLCTRGGQQDVSRAHRYSSLRVNPPENDMDMSPGSGDADTDSQDTSCLITGNIIKDRKPESRDCNVRRRSASPGVRKPLP